jgi:flavorubredoxin
MTKILDDLLYLGASDYSEHKFERIYQIEEGMAYNSYLLLDDKTVLFDTCDKSVGEHFLEALKEGLGKRKLDYIVVHHMEPDHSYELGEVIKLYPEAKILITAQGANILKEYLLEDYKERIINPCSSYRLNTGHHLFSFIPAPLVHWPEVMFSYDEKTCTLFSADAFGTFGGNKAGLFSNEITLDDHFVSEMRRYYSNIVGKFGPNVVNVLKKASALKIDRILALHGPIWVDKLDKIIALYTKWATYEPEQKDCMIVCGSVYGHTLTAAKKLQQVLAEKGVKASFFDATETEASYLVSEAFRVKTIVICSITYATNIFPPIENFLTDLSHLGLTKRTYAIMENGSWAPQAGSKIKDVLASFKDSCVLQPVLTVRGAFDEKNQMGSLEAFGDNIVNSLK